jgi:hypothetical protein
MTISNIPNTLCSVDTLNTFNVRVYDMKANATDSEATDSKATDSKATDSKATDSKATDNELNDAIIAASCGVTVDALARLRAMLTADIVKVYSISAKPATPKTASSHVDRVTAIFGGLKIGDTMSADKVFADHHIGAIEVKYLLADASKGYNPSSTRRWYSYDEKARVYKFESIGISPPADFHGFVLRNLHRFDK